MRSVPAIKVAEPESNRGSEAKKFDYSRLNHDRPLTVVSNTSQTSAQSSYLQPNALNGT